MPRYYFHVQDGRSIPDRDGTELPNLPAAKKEAVRLAGALLLDEAEIFWDSEKWYVEVTDATGVILFTLTFMGTIPERQDQS